MKERPILFNAAMVRAILAGTKTMTRRVLEPQPPDDVGELCVGPYFPTVTRREQDEPGPRTFGVFSDDGEWSQSCRFGEPGDQLWVRETWFPTPKVPAWSARPVLYAADGRPPYGSLLVDRWRPSIHMPRWASRITLEVTGVRVERLCDISEEDARAEGVAATETHWWTGYDERADGYPSVCLAPGDPAPAWMKEPRLRVERVSACEWFSGVWESINGADSWAANPWVWVVEFKRVEARSEAA